jgi:hypothetical protein
VVFSVSERHGQLAADRLGTLVDVRERSVVDVPEGQPARQHAGPYFARGRHGQCAIRTTTTELIDARFLIVDSPSDLPQPIYVDALDPERGQLSSGLLNVLPVLHVYDPDPDRDATPQGLANVRARPPMAPPGLGDRVVHSRVRRIVGRGQPNLWELEHAPQRQR